MGQDLHQFIQDNVDVDIEQCGKLIFYSILKQPKQTAATAENPGLQIETFLDEQNPLILRLYACKALIVQGNALGY